MSEIEGSQQQEPELEAIGQLTDDPHELKAKTVSSFGWATIQQIFGRVMTFGVNLALARLLIPEDFGIIATLGIFMAIAAQLSDAGFGSSLARSPKVDDADLSTVFYYNVGMSIVLYFIFFLIAPFIADYFRNPILIPVLRMMMVCLVINSLGAMHSLLAYRQMLFRQELYVQIISSIISALVGIGMAYLGYKYWALVGMTLVQAVVRNFMLWMIVQWRPKLLFVKDRLKRHFAYGSRVVTVGILNALYNNLTTILIGRYFDMRTQGLYGNANALQQVPVSALADPIMKVTTPVFVRIQHDLERLRSGYQRVMRLLFQLSTPIMVTLVVLAHPFYHFFYGDKWMEAAPYFQILCVCGILFPINTYNVNLLQVTGRGDLHLRLDVVRKIIGVLALTVGLFFGIYGLLWSMAITQAIYLFVNSYYSGKLINYTLRQQLSELFPFALMSLASGAILWLVDTYLFAGLGDLLRLALGGITMGLSYLALGWMFAPKDVSYVWGLVNHFILRRG